MWGPCDRATVGVTKGAVVECEETFASASDRLQKHFLRILTYRSNIVQYLLTT